MPLQLTPWKTLPLFELYVQTPETPSTVKLPLLGNKLPACTFNVSGELTVAPSVTRPVQPVTVKKWVSSLPA